MHERPSAARRPRWGEAFWLAPGRAAEWRALGLIALLTAALYLPMLGSFGLWDPWETHYGEVGRLITERNDWISTWWGSPWEDAGGDKEGANFFSKPILLMWMMAIGLTLFGFGEFAIRIGVCVVAIAAVCAVWRMGSSVFSERAGRWMALACATSPLFFFLSRQAQTDMPFVGLMSASVCLFMVGAFGRDRDEPADRVGVLVTYLSAAALVIPQLQLLLVGLPRWRGSLVHGDNARTLMARVSDPLWGPIVFGALLIIAAAIALVVGSQRNGWGRPRSAWALSSVAIVWGPLLGALAIALATGSSPLRDLNGWFVWGPTQVAIYASCLAGVVCWTLGRPMPTRGSLAMLGFYIFAALATLAKGLLGFMLPGAIFLIYLLMTREWRLLRRAELGRGILLFIAISFPWYAAMLIRHTRGFWDRFFYHDHYKRLVSGVHQIDEGSFEHFARWLGYGLFPWVGALPAALSRIPRFGGAAWCDRRRAELMLWIWAGIAFTLFTLSSTKFHHYIFPALPPLAMLAGLAIDDRLESEGPARPWILWLGGAALIALIGWDLVDDPRALKNLFTYKYDRKWDGQGWDWAFRAACGAAAAIATLGLLGALSASRSVRRAGFGALSAAAIAFAFFGLDYYMPRISQTWSQKGLWDAYYEQCTRVDAPPGARGAKRYCDEPAIAFKLNWRGENFYTQNLVVPIRDDDDFTHFLSQVGDGTFYGIMERSRFRGEFQRDLPARFKGRACLTYAENLKFVLAKVPCAADDPDRVADEP